ncbi:hypothetical protein GCM10011352_16430 [Marinobacterium zhoushanense]|uniref:Membrane protein insertion efficiency factor YidD n=1 Tax=Marinobacterium zhoushanense TaxID=1679163 RepID=A0ABQ1KBR9_9GAMM|nr:hypothetical protein GCM10011352_16430 [Marinobacterium zhoushanense]
MRRVAVGLINLYQRYISPYKGFRCAHAALHKGDSCSAAIKKIIEAEGLCRGFGHIRQRLNSCKQAYLQLVEEGEKEKRKRKDKEKGRWYDCCDPSAACDVAHCFPARRCVLPDLPCDCSLF